jgi:hypothetical protein
MMGAHPLSNHFKNPLWGKGKINLDYLSNTIWNLPESSWEGDLLEGIYGDHQN